MKDLLAELTSGVVAKNAAPIKLIEAVHTISLSKSSFTIDLFERLII
jgi:hypothetical protein